MLDILNKYKSFILLSIGIILIILSVFLFFYDRFEFIKSEVFASISLKKYNELQMNNNNDIVDEDNREDDNQNVDIDTEYVEDDKENDNESNDSNNNPGNTSNNNNSSSSSSKIPESEYIGFLKIDKINLNVGLVSKNSYYNNVNRNVEILKASDYPDVFNGNFIVASHSGTSKISYFKNLYKLELGDTALVYYKNYIYHYKIVDIYYVPKIGSLEIKRDKEKSVMTMITCTKNSKTEQTVYILELYSKTRNGDNND